MSTSRPVALRIAFLDYLRIFAFLSVFAGHKFYNPVARLMDDPGALPLFRGLATAVLPLLPNAGVVVFFLVSGYIITHVLQTENSREFLIRRAFRIYPLYVAAVLLQVAIGLVRTGVMPPGKIVLQQMFLVGDFFKTAYSLSGVEWTLRVEVLFYVFAAALRALGFLGPRRKWLPAILFLAIVTCRLVAPFPRSGPVFVGICSIYAPFLVLGMCFYEWEVKRMRAWLVLLLSGVVFNQYFGLNDQYQPVWSHATFAVSGFLVFAVAWALRDKLHSHPIAARISELTYAVYLLHIVIFDAAEAAFAQLGLAVVNKDVQAAIVVFVLAATLTHTIERPFIKLGRRIARRQEKGAVRPALA